MTELSLHATLPSRREVGRAVRAVPRLLALAGRVDDAHRRIDDLDRDLAQVEAVCAEHHIGRTVRSRG